MSVSRDLNEMLTKVGPGTPCGNLLRRYWMPICPAAEITPERPKKRVRVMGEDLVLFRDGRGRLGLIPEHCPHRHASLYFGFAEEDGLRCAYHGWKFATTGECIEQPFEPPNSMLKKRACRPAYPVGQLAGILFAYLGPAPAPLLPRWETLVRKDGTRSIVVLPLHRNNWLQAQENSHDPVHTFYLHGGLMKAHRKDDRFAADVAYFDRPIEAFDFDLCYEPAWCGIRKRRVFGGERPERELGHPAIFPNILIAPQGQRLATHFRLPVDDETTYIIWVEFTATRDGSEVEQSDDEIPVTYLPHPLRPDGEYDLTTFVNQDLMAWETQGPTFDRSTEMLGASDRGITMYRKLLREQIEKVARGEEPDGLVRDPALNEMIRFTFSTGQAGIFREMEEAKRRS
jgi:5,5'-dehydrodivanillate O-demethylase oxygenase subunit